MTTETRPWKIRITGLGQTIDSVKLSILARCLTCQSSLGLIKSDFMHALGCDGYGVSRAPEYYTSISRLVDAALTELCDSKILKAKEQQTATGGFTTTFYTYTLPPSISVEIEIKKSEEKPAPAEATTAFKKLTKRPAEEQSELQ